MQEDIKNERSLLQFKHKIIGNQLPLVVNKYYKNNCNNIKNGNNKCNQYKTVMYYIGILSREQITDVEMLSGLLTSNLAQKLSSAEIIKSVSYYDLETKERISRFKHQYNIFCNGNQRGIMSKQCEYNKLVLDALKIFEMK